VDFSFSIALSLSPVPVFSYLWTFRLWWIFYLTPLDFSQALLLLPNKGKKINQKNGPFNTEQSRKKGETTAMFVACFFCAYACVSLIPEPRATCSDISAFG
jgi:hypothetical protein